MPKLDKRHQKQTSEASTSFDPIPEAVYHVRLQEVNPDGEGPAGPYWTWVFEVVEPGDYTNRKLFNNTSLSEAAAFKMRETFDAFGAAYDADTDDLCGQVVKAAVGIRTIQSGDRKGELANQINRLMPKDEDFEVPEEVAAAGQPAADDLF